MDTNWNQLIERYLNGELSAEGKAGFETELAKNPDLKQEFELHKLTQDVIKRASTRNLVQQSAKSYHFRKMVTNAGILVLIVAAITTAVLLFTNSGSNSEKPTPETEELIETALLDDMNKALQFENIDPQYFKFTGENDVFLSESGVLLSITDNSFLLNGKPYHGEAVVQWQEAQQAAEIVKAGLSTLSRDKLLETQGMFSLNAFTPEGKQLQLSNSGIYVQVPVDELKKDMMLFNGVKGKNGSIDWQTPVELERLPKPKSMAKMDLFPPKYEPKLNELKWFTDKAKRDSLYLSFDEHSLGIPYATEPYNLAQDSYNGIVDTIAYKDELEFALEGVINGLTNDRDLQGEILYLSKCAVCHNLNNDGTGPNLAGVRQRWADGGAKEGSIYKWVVNSSEAASIDKYASKIYASRPSLMSTFPELNGKQELIDAIFDYIDSQPNYPSDSISHKNHIPPSKVLAIWNTKFDNTILATQDFEDRMIAIHNTCDEKVFDVYVNNLNEPLWKLDERVVKMGYPEFQKFADQKVGSINMKDEHQKNLQTFYDQAIRTIQKRGKTALLADWEKQDDWNKTMLEERSAESYRRGTRTALNKSEEADFNLKHLSKQLGQTLGFKLTNQSFPVGTTTTNSSSGFNTQSPKSVRDNRVETVTRNPQPAFGNSLPMVVNIDRLTPQLLSSKESVKVNLMNKSKSAELTYTPFNIHVDSYKNFDRLYFYLMPDEINSFERLDFTSGILNTKLNEQIKYKGVIAGMSEKGYFIYDIYSLKPGNLGTVQLIEVSEKEFGKRINALNKSRSSKPMEILSELNWLFKEKANYKVQKQRKKDAEFRAVMLPTIYSCELHGVEISEPSQESAAKNVKATARGTANSELSPPPRILEVVEDPASYSGGRTALLEFLNLNIKYPQRAIDEGISGKAYLKFIVSETGKISNVIVTRKLPGCPECDAEAKRVVEMMPDWTPAKNEGKNVATWYTLPIVFSAK